MRLRQRLGAGLREQLGAILVRKGRITEVELQEALEGAGPGERLGEALVRSGSIFEPDLAHALAEQFGLKYISLDVRHLDREASTMLPEATARELDALLLRFGGDRAYITVADPTDILAADSLRMVVGMDVELAVSERSAIRAAIEHLYGGRLISVAAEPVDAAPMLAVAPVSAIDASADDVAPAIEVVNALLRRAIDLNASDVHFIPQRDQMLVRARVDGALRDLQSVPAQLVGSVTARLKIMGQLDITERRLPQDGRVSITFGDTDIDLRIAVLPSVWGEDVVLRILYLAGADGRRTLGDLGMDGQTSDVLQWALRQPSGAILVCGPTGSGKTTTLYAALEALRDGERSLITIEDPVEAQLDGVVQVGVNPRVGLTFARGLRTILRADPDVILVGEIRDAETAEIAMQAAMTGHLVLSTLHAESATAAIARLRNMGVSSDLLAAALRCVVSQRLLRRSCPSCTRLDPLTAEAAQAGGCSDCSWTRYAGRTGVYEALAVTDALGELFNEGTNEIALAARDAGMTTLLDNARALVERGATTEHEVQRVCGDASPPG